MSLGWKELLAGGVLSLALLVRRRRAERRQREGQGASGSTPEEGDAQRRFAEEVAERYRATGRFSAVTVDHAELALRLERDGKGAGTAYLANLFAETRDVSPAERERLIGRSLAAGLRMLEPAPPDFASVRDQLMPTLRGTTYGDGPFAGRPGGGLVRRPFLPYLDVFYVVDQPDSMMYVTRQHLADWGIDEARLHEAAFARLPLLANPKMRPHGLRHGPSVAVASGDDYEIERLLVPGWLAAQAAVVRGRPVAILPRRGALVVGGDADPEALVELLDMAQREYEASPRRVSPALYTVDDAGQVTPLLAAGSEGLSGRLRVAAEQLAIAEHREQKAALDKTLGEEQFVATYAARQLPDGAVVSSCAWTEGVPTLLPRTDRVALVRPSSSSPGARAEVTVVPWARVAPRLEPVPGLRPDRYRTGAFPTREEVAAWPDAELATG